MTKIRGNFITNSRYKVKDAFNKSNLIGTIGTLGEGALGIMDAITKNASIADTSDLESSIQSANSSVVTANNLDDIMAAYTNYNPLENVTWRDIRGSNVGQQIGNTASGMLSGASAGFTVGGPIGAIIGGGAGLIGGIAGMFGGNAKARKQARSLNTAIDQSNAFNWNKLDNVSNNLTSQLKMNQLANFSAFGGPLNFYDDSILSYDLALKDLSIKELNSKAKNDKMSNKLFAKGGKIYIKPENRGKFTASAKRAGMGVQEYASHILSNKEDYSPTLIKRAVFAKNAKKWKHAYGGNLLSDNWDNNVIIVGNGGSHSENPLEGVPMGVDNQGVPNLVEEGEVIFNDYVYSNRLKPEKFMLNELGFPTKYKGKTFAEIAKDVQKESEERPLDNISKNGLEDSMNKLQLLQESVRDTKNKGSKFARGGELLRYAPVVGSGLSVLGDMLGVTNKPDYSYADLIGNVGDTLQYISPKYIDDYITYKPLDTNYTANKLASQAGATRRAITNQGGNRAATIGSLLAADYNAQRALGDAYIADAQSNWEKYLQSKSFNRGTNQYNAEALLKTAIANQEQDKLRLTAALQEANLRNQIEAMSSAGRSSNLTNLFENLGNIGIDILNREDIRKRAELTPGASAYVGKNGGKLNKRRGGLNNG